MGRVESTNPVADARARPFGSCVMAVLVLAVVGALLLLPISELRAGRKEVPVEGGTGAGTKANNCLSNEASSSMSDLSQCKQDTSRST